MALYTNRNLGPHSSGDESIYALKDWLTSSHGGTQHWSVKSSGDGLSAYSGAGDVITSSSSGANGLGNNNAWFVLEDPDANREILVQRGSNSYQWRLLYSRAAGFTGGNATTAPTASDEQGWARGLNTTDQNLFGGSTGLFWRLHICAEGDSAEGDVWPFWVIARYTTTGNVLSTILCDAVVDSTSASEDTDKAIFLAGGTDSLSVNSGTCLSRQGSSFLVGYMNYDDSNETWGRFQAMYYATYIGSTENINLPSSLVLSPESQNPAMAPLIYIRNEASDITNGPKGVSSLLSWNPCSGLYYGSVIYDGTYYYIAAGSLLFKGWPDFTSPIV